jgi:uncharacterized membrane protein YuzA (DUF378 family)
MMSLAAQISGDLKFLWRAIFLVVGVLGVINTLWLIPRVASRYPNAWFIRRGRIFVALLYILIAIVAGFPGLAPRFGVVKPLQIEGTLVSLILFLGVNVAWEFMAQPKLGEKIESS